MLLEVTIDIPAIGAPRHWSCCSTATSREKIIIYHNDRNANWNCPWSHLWDWQTSKWHIVLQGLGKTVLSHTAGKNAKRMEKTWQSKAGKWHMRPPLTQRSLFQESTSKIHCKTTKWCMPKGSHCSTVNSKRMETTQMFINYGNPHKADTCNHINKWRTWFHTDIEWPPAYIVKR